MKHHLFKWYDHNSSNTISNGRFEITRKSFIRKMLIVARMFENEVTFYAKCICEHGTR